MTTEETRPKTLQVCAAVLLQQGKILITQRPAEKQLGGYWEFPGGKIEADETPQQALLRELKEELDIAVNVGAQLTEVIHHYEWGTVQIKVYLCRWRNGTIRHLDVADHCWVTPEQLSGFNMLPADMPILQQLQSINIDLL